MIQSGAKDKQDFHIDVKTRDTTKLYNMKILITFFFAKKNLKTRPSLVLKVDLKVFVK
jgi:hypothetical protein